MANGNSGATFTIDWTAAQKQTITLNNNCTFTFTAPTGVGNFTLRVVQDGSGNRLATWPSPSVKWPGGSAPQLSQAPGAVDLISYYYNGTNYYGTFSLNLM